MHSLPRYVLIIWVLFLSLLYSATTAIQVIGHSTFVNAGEDATLYCELVETKEKLKRITWQKRIRGVSINKDFFVITPDGKTENKNGLGDRTEFIGNIQKIIGTVLLKNVTLLDEGVYTCIFNTFPNGQFQAGIYLHVQVPPVVSVRTDMIPVVGESTVTLATCTAAKARPEAVVSWRLNALSDSVEEKTALSENSDGTFTVKSFLIGVPFKDLNQQKVQCLVKHISLRKQLILDYTLVIHYPPQGVSVIPVHVSTVSQEFQCAADANPRPRFIWSRVNKSLPGPVNADRLIIPMTSDNNGLYLCNVLNEYGNATGVLNMHASTESSPVCWILFTISFLGITVVYLIWKFKLTGRLNTLISFSRERTGHISVSINSPQENKPLRQQVEREPARPKDNTQLQQTGDGTGTTAEEKEECTGTTLDPLSSDSVTG